MHAPLFQIRANDFARRWIVVYDQDLEVLQSLAALFRHLGCVSGTRQAQPEPESRTLAQLAFQANGSTHHFDQSFANREAHTRSPVFTDGRLVPLHESLDKTILRR